MTGAALRWEFWIKPSRSLAKDCCGVSKEAEGSRCWPGVAHVRLWGFWLTPLEEKTLDGGIVTWKTGA